MQLYHSVYEGPGFWGISRMVASMEGIRLIIHGARGDDYVAALLPSGKRSLYPNLLCTNIGRNELITGAQNRLIHTIQEKNKENSDFLSVVVETCTTNLLKEDIQQTVHMLNSANNSKTLIAPHHPFKDKELSAADKFLKSLLELYYVPIKKTPVPSVNIIGPAVLGFLAKQDLDMMKNIMNDLGIKINCIFPLNGSLDNLKKIGQGWVNITICPEISLSSLEFLKYNYDIPYILIPPSGITPTNEFITQLSHLTDRNYNSYISKRKNETSVLWFLNILREKIGRTIRAFVFGDFGHTVSITRAIAKDLDFEVVLAGTYVTSFADKFKNAVQYYAGEIVTTDNSLLVAELIKKYNPDIIFGTLNEQRIGSEMQIPFIDISSPVRYPGSTPLISSYASFLGYKGFDNLLNSLSRKLFSDSDINMNILPFFFGHSIHWTEKADKYLMKIPLMLRNQVYRIIENYAKSNDKILITEDIIIKARENIKIVNNCNLSI
ncbi:MAG: nitrogenase component 1 [Chitinispirillia bacterium]